MDDRRFDNVTRAFGKGGSRRALLKSLLGLGGIATASTFVRSDAESARRGYSGPPFLPRPTEPPLGECPGLECNGSCCGRLDTECCGGFCCTGGCHETECCGAGNTWCDGYGCCPGICMDDPLCCPHDQICGSVCCGSDGYCCVKEDGSKACTLKGRCCSNLQCPGGRCDSAGFCH